MIVCDILYGIQFYSFSISILFSLFLTIFISFVYVDFSSTVQDLFNVLEPPRILLSSGCPVSKKYRTSDYLDPDNNDYDEN